MQETIMLATPVVVAIALFVWKPMIGLISGGLVLMEFTKLGEVIGYNSGNVINNFKMEDIALHAYVMFGIMAMFQVIMIFIQLAWKFRGGNY